MQRVHRQPFENNTRSWVVLLFLREIVFEEDGDALAAAIGELDDFVFDWLRFEYGFACRDQDEPLSVAKCDFADCLPFVA